MKVEVKDDKQIYDTSSLQIAQKTQIKKLQNYMLEEIANSKGILMI